MMNKMIDLKVVEEVNVLDQFVAVMDFLKAMGYDTSKLTALDVAVLKSDITRAIGMAEKIKM
jgi:hypothetical protein